ncbi:MAG: thiol-disulfide oxidoreductase [Bacteroidota bacterium]|nr:thiol-disulfide oxidoreductase [Bacteroidota bacterium]
MNNSPGEKIVLFDGVCNFCSSSVQFIIKHDKSNSLKFASLQSPTGQQLLARYHIPKEVDSVIFIDEGRAFTKSDAAFRVAKYFSGIWKASRVFLIVPASVRNFFYDIIAKNRYKWFGKKDSCMIPSPEIRDRFIDV